MATWAEICHTLVLRLTRAMFAARVRADEQAELEDAVKELNEVPEGHDLHLYLPDICRTRYDVADLNRAIAPLLKKLPGEARIRPPFRGA